MGEVSGIGFGEIAVILVVALLVFGPDRLPTMIKQAASFVKDLRTMVANARRDLSDSVGDLGIDQEDLKLLSDLRNPKSYLREKVLDGVEPKDLGLDEFDDVREELDLPGKRKAKRTSNGAGSGTRRSGAAGSSSSRAGTNGSDGATKTASASPSTSAGPAKTTSTVATPASEETVPASPLRFDPDAT